MLKIIDIKKQRGFGLMDLIIALGLTGLIIQLGWQLGNQHQQQQGLAKSASQLNMAMNALEQHLMRMAYLPCPDTTGNGFENRHSSGRCIANHGRWPFLTLMASNPTDAFGQPFYYAVHQWATSNTHARNHRYACASASLFAFQGSIDNTFYQNPTGALFCTQAQCGHTEPEGYNPSEHADQPWCQSMTQVRDTPPYFNRLTPPLGTSSALNGSLRVCTNNPNECRSNTPRSQHAGNQVVAVLISFGANGHTAWHNCDQLNDREQMNCNYNGYFQQDPLSRDFDDQLRWLTIHRVKDLLHDQIDWHQTASQ
jgi:hypothetical protein